MQQSFEEIMTSIKERRKSLGLTQLQLAEMCGIKQSNYSRMESGRQMPSLDTLLNILSHLHMDIDLVRTDYNVYKDANDEEPFLTIEKPRRLKKTSMNSTPEKNIMPYSDFEIQERRAREDICVAMENRMKKEQIIGAIEMGRELGISDEELFSRVAKKYDIKIEEIKKILE